MNENGRVWHFLEILARGRTLNRNLGTCEKNKSSKATKLSFSETIIKHLSAVYAFSVTLRVCRKTSAVRRLDLPTNKTTLNLFPTLHGDYMETINGYKNDLLW